MRPPYHHEGIRTGLVSLSRDSPLRCFPEMSWDSCAGMHGHQALKRDAAFERKLLSCCSVMVDGVNLPTF